MKKEKIRFHLFFLIIISIFFIFLFPFFTLATSYLPGDFVGPMGDPTPDGKVDFNDLMVFATAYGSETGDSNWNELCDICGYLGDPTPDGKVNFDDLMIFATDYGKTLPVHNLTKGTYYNIIQAALDNADNNNTIEVSDGTYDESITFPSGKKIILQSVNGPSSTIIRGHDNSDTVYLNSSLEGTTLEGFTITHTDGLTGSGIYITNSNVKINNCNISGNYSNTVCVGIYNDGDLTITESNISGNSNNSSNEDDWCFGISNSGVLNINKCTISGNFSNNWCFAIYNSYGNLSISESSIFNNFATNFLCCGIFINSGDLTITGSNIYGNSGAYGGGIYFDFPTCGVLPIGGEIEGEKNTICGNFSIGNNPSLDQQIADAVGSLYDTYKDINYISAYCE